ncbi:MAG: hypothetical protein IKG89_02795 [Oscillospiraceae bacterium]|nr:hypothetical protein [Oscillospiraceae bacterium]
MNIQPNILIWTILCFCAFMLILWRLLLRPLLRFMDAREARIAHARSLDKSAQRAEEKARREAERQLALRRIAEEGRRELQAQREAGEAELNAQALAFRQETERQRTELEAEAAALVPELATALRAHVDAFTEKLMSFGER